MAQSKKRNIVRLYTDDKRKTKIFSHWRNATSPIDIPMILARRFVIHCKRGSPWECLLAEAVKQLAEIRPDAFPHKVEMVYVNGTSLYVVTHFPKRPDAKYHSVRYQHNFTRRLRRFDTYNRRRFMQAFGDESIVVRIKPPRMHGRPGHRGVAGRSTGEHTRTVLRGAARRAHDAGVTPQVAV